MRVRNEMPADTPRDVPVALLGYGTVGSAVDGHLRTHGDALARLTGIRLHVTRALVRDPSKERPVTPLPGVLTTDFRAIRDDDSVVAVAEVMGGLDPTRSYIEQLLSGGKAVATANKQLLARDNDGLLHRVRAGGSVCGAVPVLETLRTSLPPGAVSRVLGIVNGTTNFVLTLMHAGVPYADALAEAQRRGYAESDPTEDVSGADAAAKMAIIASTAFGVRVRLDHVAFEGITQVDAGEIRLQQRRGRVLRLVGTATPNRVEVRLAALEQEHPLARVAGVDNAVLIEGAGFNTISLSGPGAGGPATATAVVADLLELVR